MNNLYYWLLVAQSKCSSYVGIQGIVVKETKKMFTLITESDELKGIFFFFTSYLFLVYKSKKLDWPWMLS